MPAHCSERQEQKRAEVVVRQLSGGSTRSLSSSHINYLINRLSASGDCARAAHSYPYNRPHGPITATIGLGPNYTGLRQPITCRAPSDVSATVIDRFALTRFGKLVHGGGGGGGYRSKWVFYENHKLVRSR